MKTALNKGFPITTILTILTNIADQNTVSTVFKAIRPYAGTVHVLIANAVVLTVPHPISKSSTEKWSNSFMSLPRCETLISRLDLGIDKVRSIYIPWIILNVCSALRSKQSVQYDITDICVLALGSGRRSNVTQDFAVPTLEAQCFRPRTSAVLHRFPVGVLIVGQLSSRSYESLLCYQIVDSRISFSA